jgi:hypothetical protein
LSYKQVPIGRLRAAPKRTVKVVLGTKDEPMVIDNQDSLKKALDLLAAAIPKPPWYSRPLNKISDAELAQYGVTRDSFLTVKDR